MVSLALLLEPHGNVSPLRPRAASAPLIGPAESSPKGISLPGPALVDYEASFAQLYRRAYDVAYKLLGYRAEAEDVAQEALARAYLHWTTIHAYAEPWVVRVASNLAIGSWRKQRRRTRLIDDGDLAPGDVVSAHESASVVEHLALRQALGQLSKRQREVAVLRHLAGFSERETAAVLGCSTGTVKQHSSRGLAKLKVLLGDQAENSANDDPEQVDPDQRGR